jgi:hypothetical protein
MAKPKTKAKETFVLPQREVKYDKVTIWKCLGEKSMKAQLAKDLLGWKTEDEFIFQTVGEAELDKEQRESLLNAGGLRLTDCLGNKVICDNDVGNRPWHKEWSRELMHSILNKRWRFNGEAAQIGKTGRVLSFQHRGIALIFAQQIWESEEPDHKGKYHWRALWEEEPSIEMLVVLGIDEDTETTRTLDNVRKRTLADVIYADTGTFHDLTPKERKDAAKILQHTIKFLWQRTGAKDNAFAPFASHSESLDFLGRHDRVKAAVRHILIENGGTKKKIAEHITPGFAAGCLYLMGCDQSDRDKYAKQDPRMEKTLKWVNWDKAEEFWVAFCGDSSFKDVRVAIDQESKLTEKTCVLAKAWKCFLEEQRPTSARVRLKKEKDSNGEKDILVEWPDFGGIDQGPPREAPVVSGVPTEPDAPTDPSDADSEETPEEKTPSNGRGRGRKKKQEVVAEEDPIEEEEGDEPVDEEVDEEEGGEVVRDDADEIPLQA